MISCQYGFVSNVLDFDTFYASDLYFLICNGNKTNVNLSKIFMISVGVLKVYGNISFGF